MVDDVSVYAFSGIVSYITRPLDKTAKYPSIYFHVKQEYKNGHTHELRCKVDNILAKFLDGRLWHQDHVIGYGRQKFDKTGKSTFVHVMRLYLLSDRWLKRKPKRKLGPKQKEEVKKMTLIPDDF